MTKYEVFLSETARKQLNELPVDLQKRIKKALVNLKEDPFRSRPKADIKKLKGPKRYYYRLRIGDYRAIYIVEGNRILVAKILPRSNAYYWIE
ncbi:MAG: type II toxin-antitoxin system RelE/ParE family toxin [Thermoplasmatales archaeon]|nr:type II toxin-antitoxin system RelE/ParE family toxin [Candidatus Methanoperedenaceae archaeon]MCG2827566.1 type II toxin-antitoxin system RelE/ParE family toxin [Thermoplasmatales archaeon]